jgi:hypothetical protein
VFNQIANDLRVNTGSNKEPQLTMAVASALDIMSFLISHKSSKSENYKQFVNNGLTKLVNRIEFLNDFEASFLSADPQDCPVILNFKILNAMTKFNPEIVNTNT